VAQDNLILKEKLFPIIAVAYLDSLMKANYFSAEDQEWIKAIKEKFPNACIIFYFLNRDFGRYSRGSFLPIYNNITELDESPNDKEITSRSLVPWTLDKSDLCREAIENIIERAHRNSLWKGEYGFVLQLQADDETDRLDLSPYAGVPGAFTHARWTR